MTFHSARLQDRMQEILAQFQMLEGPLLPILHAVHAEWGHIPADTLPVIADALNISRAEVHGVVTFYHDFRELPPGRHMVRICRAEACQAMGANALADHARSVLGVDWHGTTADGAFSLEPVYCLGLCACGPAAQIDGRILGRVTIEKLDEILNRSRP